MREFKTVLIWEILSGWFLFGWFWKKQLFGSNQAPLKIKIQHKLDPTHQFLA
jgi:hypothetical protein